MNAAVLFLTSACMAGADSPAPVVVPAPVPAAGAAMVAPLGGCGSCNTGCGSGCGAAGCSGAHDECPGSARPNLMSKLKAKFGGGGGCSSCGTPAYSGYSTAGCDSCDSGGKHGGLFSRMKMKSGHGGGCDTCATGSYGYGAAPTGCAIPAAPMVVPTPAPAAPTPMPTAPEQKVPETKKTTQITVPPVVVTPVSGPRVTPPLGGSNSPF